MTDPPPTLQQSATVLGAAIWYERRAFEVVGGLVAATTEPRAKVVLSTVSRHAAQRAEQLASVLPRTHDLRPDELIVAGPGADQLDRLADAAAVADRLDVLAAILTGSAERLGAHRARLVPIADAPIIRVLDLVVADLESDHQGVVAAGDGVSAH